MVSRNWGSYMGQNTYSSHKIQRTSLLGCKASEDWVMQTIKVLSEDNFSAKELSSMAPGHNISVPENGREGSLGSLDRPHVSQP